MKNKAYPTWFAGGALLLYGVFVLLPALLGLGFSFTDWNAYSNDIHWVGLDNFAAIFDPTSNYLERDPEHGSLHGCHDRPQDRHRAWPGDPPDQRREEALLSLPGAHLPARGSSHPHRGRDLSVRSQPGHRAAELDAPDHRTWRPRPAVADRCLDRALERDRRRYLARRRLHHGHPDRRAAGHPSRLLRGGVHRRSLEPTGLPAHHPAAPDAGPVWSRLCSISCTACASSTWSSF